jgi:hypothetical protein
MAFSPTDIAVVGDRVLVSDRVTAILPPTLNRIIDADQIALAFYACEYERSPRIVPPQFLSLLTAFSSMLGSMMETLQFSC